MKDEYFDKKSDKGKSPLSLIPFDAISCAADVLEFGLHKYSEDSWKTVPDAVKRYESAMLRHFAATQRGEAIDPESGLSHRSHMLCNAIFLMWFELHPQVNVDDAVDYMTFSENQRGNQ